ncbi:hypothetical protein LIER_03299 [Lithospermum erythrorhizon]|uniref:Uncharacterized protein n=1 Tax=Lithospermum erythrorhizon TaxID=34254 RepID=A0AAV3NUA7_LITER
MDRWKDSTSLAKDVLEPSVANITTEGMDTKYDDLEPVTIEATDAAGQEEIETMNDDVEGMTPEKKRLEKKKSNKRKYRKLTDVGTSEPKKKLSKEEKAAKRARKAERRGRKAAKANASQKNEVEEVMPEEVIPRVGQPSVDDEWSHTDGTVQLLRDEIRYLNGVIQSSMARKSVLEARLRSLTGDDDPDDGVADA